MKGDDIAERFLEFAVQVLVTTQDLPKDPARRHIMHQLIRTATACGANYEEARAAESRADFIHKIAVAAKEIRESL